MLFDAGAGTDIRDKDENTILILASRAGNIKVVRHCLETGTNKELYNKEGYIALDLATEFKHKRIISLLTSNEEIVSTTRSSIFEDPRFRAPGGFFSRMKRELTQTSNASQEHSTSTISHGSLRKFFGPPTSTFPANLGTKTEKKSRLDSKVAEPIASILPDVDSTTMARRKREPLIRNRENSFTFSRLWTSSIDGSLPEQSVIVFLIFHNINSIQV